MNIIETLKQIDRAVDAAIELFQAILWNVFDPLQNYVIVPTSLGGDEAWTYLTMFVISIWVASFKTAKILPDEKSWLLTFVRLTFGRLIQFGIPFWILLWFLGAYVFSGSKLPYGFFSQLSSYLQHQLPQFEIGLIWGFGIGASLVWTIGRYLEPAIDRILAKATNTTSSQKSLSDVRDVAKELPKPKAFDPCKYFPRARQKDSIFVGEDAKGKPLILPRQKFNNSNTLMVAPTRRGKGVLTSVILSQLLQSDNPDIVFVIDPKMDDWSPLVLRDACKKAGLPFIYINARRDQSPQFNPFGGATKSELIPLIAAGYDLHPRGSSDDFYRYEEQDAVEDLLAECSDNPSIEELYSIARSSLNDDETENIKSLLTKLKQDAKLSSLSSSGPKLEDIRETGGVFWIVGSEDDPSVSRIMRIAAYRAIQVLRNRTDKSRHATLFFDEAKHSVSGPLYKAYGTLIGPGNASIISAIQSKSDFIDVPQNLNPNAVSQAVFDNSDLKLIFRTHNPQTVDWVVSMEGSKVIKKTRNLVSRNMELAETNSSEKSSSQEEVPYLHRNHILHLPDACAILIGFGIAKFAYTSPIKVAYEEIKPTHAQSDKSAACDELAEDHLL